MSDTRYTLLPGKGRQLAGTEWLLLADDHLLLARRRFYLETYQRFFFSDIQAFTLTGSRAREAVAAALLGLFLLLAWAFWLSDSLGARLFWGTFALGAILASLVNWLRGPGVRCHLTTALQTVALTPLNRRPQAERVLSDLEARIRQAQAGLPDLETSASPAAPELAVETSPAPAGKRSKPPPLPTAYSGSWHRLLFAVLLAHSAATYWQLRTEGLAADFVGTAFTLLALTFAVIAVLRQRVLVVARPLKTLAWTAVGFMLALLIGGYVSGLYLGIANALEMASATGGAIGPLAAPIQPEPLSWFSLVGTTTIGLAGLAVMSSSQPRRPRASSLG